MLAKPTSTDEHGEHIVPLKVYFGVAGALFFLTMLTLAMSFVDLGSMNMLVAMLIAGFKASLVALIFMHLWWDNKFLMAIFLTALLFLAIFIGITLMDTMNRGEIYQQSGQPINPQSAIYTRSDTSAPAGEPIKASSSFSGTSDTTQSDTTQTHAISDSSSQNSAKATQNTSKTDSGGAQ